MKFIPKEKNNVRDGTTYEQVDFLNVRFSKNHPEEPENRYHQLLKKHWKKMEGME